MEKSFVGFGPGSSALPVRSQDGGQSLIRRGRGRAGPYSSVSAAGISGRNASAVYSPTAVRQ